VNKKLVFVETDSPVGEWELPSVVKVRNCSSPMSVVELNERVYVFGELDPDERELVKRCFTGELKLLPVRLGWRDWELVKDGVMIHDDHERTYTIYVEKDYTAPKIKGV